MSDSVSIGDTARPGRRGAPGWAIAIAVVGVIAVGLLAYCGSQPDQTDVHAAADNAAYELERTPITGLGVDIFDVQQAIDQGNRGRYQGNPKYNNSVASNLKVDYAQGDKDGEYYEITTKGGKHPVCLDVKVDIPLGSRASVYPTVTVTDGRCQIT